MSEESTTPGLVELTRRSYEFGPRRDLDAAMRDYGPDSVWNMSQVGLGSFEGLAAIRSFFEDWFGAYEELEVKPEQRRSRTATTSTKPGGGVPIDTEGAHVWTIRNAKAVRLEIFADRSVSLKSVGLAE